MKIIGVDNLIKASNDELYNELKSKDLEKLSNKLVGFYRHNKDNKQVLMYRGAIGKYQELIKNVLSSGKYVVDRMEENQEGQNQERENQEGDGINKRNGYKIVNSKYNDKLLINMPKLLNEMIIEAKLSNDDNILYSNKCDKCTIDLLTKRFNPKKNIVN